MDESERGFGLEFMAETKLKKKNLIKKTQIIEYDAVGSKKIKMIIIIMIITTTTTTTTIIIISLK